MKKLITIFVFICLPVFADTCRYDEIVHDIRNSCSDILNDLNNLKTMAGINTAVTGAGTLSAAGALYAGVNKANIDKQANDLKKQLDDIENMSDEEFLAFLKAMGEYEESLNTYQTNCNAKKEMEKKSKTLGNVRTGLMAGNTATAIAGTVIANKNKNKSKTISEKINDCLTTINLRRDDIIKSRFDCGEQEYENLHKMEKACRDFSPKHLEKITTNSTIATVSSAINIGTGVAGTATSAAANSDSVRNNDTDAGVRREKKLNTSANVFAGASAVASGVSTIFNAMTIKAINDNLKIAQSCMEALN